MNSEENGLLMKFTENQLNEIEDLSALNYCVKQIAMYFDVDLSLLYKEFDQPDSVFKYHYDRGQLIAQVEIDKANLQSAKSGNITAMIRYDKRSKEIKYQERKKRILRSS